ncbi:flagellar hook assembly protein FlgD [Pseudoblastomonas halimionae]|uniref:Basal-body rod modification protein FlgD n=1 Tax=Alteriqipengyuania halimionae TaxID=1926630 RepID=A0A6I4U7K9_9SPHN|nr:flagellar hook capping FlgD N-terminal domain-containing protein [Alteriqipengyuania halimionae]MXP10432.1 flagellar hook assembly protein FlgD [Alteriqipengyuania halimionae]
MTEISSITPNLQGNTEANRAGAELNANFDMFLKLLTTQMQNQDPLDPMDTSDYTQQLVQYSQVEQSIQQTGTLKDILAALSTQDLAQSANFIGQRAELDSPTSALSDQRPAQWSWEAERSIAALTATITDVRGRVIETRELDPSSAGEMAWDGSLSAGGGTAAAGAYTLSLSATDAAGQEVPVAIRSTGVIDEVATRNGTVMLGINGLNFPTTSLVRVIAEK